MHFLSSLIPYLVCLTLFFFSFSIGSKEKIDSAIIQSGGTQDPFHHLSQADLKTLWSTKPERSFNLLDLFQHEVFIDVVLVGLSELPEEAFKRYFDALAEDNAVNILNPANNGSRLLPIKKKFIFHTSMGEESLLKSLNKVVTDHLEIKNNSISIDKIDEIIKSDYQRSHLSYAIYILNLEKQQSKYWYVLDEESCPTVLWSGKERYMWIDLNAGPVTWGPSTMGFGMVTESSVPYLSHHRLRPHPFYERQDGFDHVQALMMDLTSLIKRTVDFMITPSLDHFPVTTYSDITFLLVMMHDRVGEYGEPTLLDWEWIQKEFSEIPLLPGQKLNFRTTEKSMLDCLYCYSAYNRALKTHSTTDITADGFLVSDEFYIDSIELHHWIKTFWTEITDEPVSPENSSSLLFPVFLFQISKHKPSTLLFDRIHQAIPFPDMILSVQQTNSSKLYFDYICDYGAVWQESGDATRAVMASMLQSVWAVAPTHKKWSLEQNQTIEDYLWSMSRTPFGEISKSRSLSFSHRDAIVQHQLLTLIDKVIVDVREVFLHLTEFKKEISDAFSPSEFETFIWRWNLLRYKLSTSMRYLSHFDYKNCFSYVKSMRYDIDTMHSLIHNVGKRFTSYLYCENESQVNISSLQAISLLSSFLVLCGFLVFMVRNRKSSKRKGE